MVSEPASGASGQHDDGRTFMMSSGRRVPIPEIPMPAFDVPYAAPMAVGEQEWVSDASSRAPSAQEVGPRSSCCSHERTTMQGCKWTLELTGEDHL